MTFAVMGYLLMAAAAPAPEARDLRWVVAPPAADAKMPRPRPDARLRALGRSLYRARCAACHGESGDGRGVFAPGLTVPPTNFTVGVYKLRSTPPGSIPTDEDLFRTVTRGVHGTPMLPWPQLGEEDRWALVFQLQAFSVRFREERPLPSIPVPPPPLETEALAARGAALYARLRCATCHGETGAADGPARRTYLGTPVRIRDFTRGRFIRGAEMGDIYLTLRAGIEGTPMGSYDALREDDIWALAAYVRSLVRDRPLHDLPPARNQARTP